MKLELTKKQYRRLLDLAYIGNWILNSTRGSDRFEDYDKVESRLFSYCKDHGMASLTETWNGQPVPSRAFAEGGIHEAIMDDELIERMDEYMEEFERNGTDRLQVEDL